VAVRRGYGSLRSVLNRKWVGLEVWQWYWTCRLKWKWGSGYSSTSLLWWSGMKPIGIGQGIDD
jgi:hypothetical protein